MTKFRTSKVGGSARKNTNYSTGKKYSFRSQEEMIEKRKELLQKQKDKEQNA